MLNSSQCLWFVIRGLASGVVAMVGLLAIMCMAIFAGDATARALGLPNQAGGVFFMIYLAAIFGAAIGVGQCIEHRKFGGRS